MRLVTGSRPLCDTGRRPFVAHGRLTDIAVDEVNPPHCGAANSSRKHANANICSLRFGAGVRRHTRQVPSFDGLEPWIYGRSQPAGSPGLVLIPRGARPLPGAFHAPETINTSSRFAKAAIW